MPNVKFKNAPKIVQHMSAAVKNDHPRFSYEEAYEIAFGQAENSDIINSKGELTEHGKSISQKHYGDDRAKVNLEEFRKRL